MRDGAQLKIDYLDTLGGSGLRRLAIPSVRGLMAGVYSALRGFAVCREWSNPAKVG